jgi:hypothetical protein
VRGLSGKPITQFEWVRPGVINKEMVFAAERKYLGRRRLKTLPADVEAP